MIQQDLTEKAEIMDAKAMSRAIARITYEILEKNKGVEDLCVIGIRSRGVYLAERIAAKMEEIEGKTVRLGNLDITPFRDDRERCEKEPDRSEIPFSVQGITVILVDDVIYTGRSVRAAIDALIRRGRPQKIQLAALVDRGHRELPIRADYIGKNLPTSREEVVKVMMKECDGCDRVAIFGRQA